MTCSLRGRRFCGKENGRIKAGQEGSLHVSNALLVLARPSSHRPSICYWVFKDEEVAVFQPVPGVLIMECGAESMSEKKKKNKKPERGREERTSPSLPTPPPRCFSCSRFLALAPQSGRLKQTTFLCITISRKASSALDRDY